ncbi:hypothetical protein DMENIID0001_156920 [Sergentomyia squamirostris]
MAPTMQATPPIKQQPGEQGVSTRRPETGASGSSMYTFDAFLFHILCGLFFLIVADSSHRAGIPLLGCRMTPPTPEEENHK